VNFTGSTGVGRVIAQIAAKHLKPVLLELGGKAPLLVLADADLDEAAAAANFGAFMNQGQICMSTERLVVDERIADEFVRKLAVKASALLAGDPRHAALGTLISAEAARRIRALVDDAVEKGARIAAGGGLDGAVMQATVIDGVKPTMKLYREESFGPVVAVIRAEDEDDAIRIANDSPYGLSAAIFSRDIARALDLAGRIESGICHINGPTVHAVRRREGQRLRPFRRQGIGGGIHRSALDYRAEIPPPLPDLTELAFTRG
jgi:acyl-CoA reductase-like NAD-dependent aldehyde dehydrogenase